MNEVTFFPFFMFSLVFGPPDHFILAPCYTQFNVEVVVLAVVVVVVERGTDGMLY